MHNSIQVEGRQPLNVTIDNNDPYQMNNVKGKTSNNWSKRSTRRDKEESNNA